jgi:hypothetical protein
VTGAEIAATAETAGKVATGRPGKASAIGVLGR